MDQYGIPGTGSNTGGNPGRDYALGAFFIILAVASFVYLDGPAAVFIGIAGAIGGAVCIIRALQNPAEPGPDPLQLENDAITQNFDDGFDWDAHYQRDFGSEQPGQPGQPGHPGQPGQQPPRG